jgi:hypothetical protein
LRIGQPVVELGETLAAPAERLYQPRDGKSGADWRGMPQCPAAEKIDGLEDRMRIQA